MSAGLATAWRSFRNSSRACPLLLCSLVLFAYVPVLVFRLSLNPMNFGSWLVVSAHRGITLGGPWLDPNASFTTQALGKLSADDWLHGVIPWWNPYTGVGVPLAGEMQTSSLFMPFVLLLHFTNGVILLKMALQMIAGLATYALVRQLGMGRLAAFGAAAVFQFNGPFAWFAHGPIMPIAFLPLLLLGIERAFSSAEEGRRGGWVLLGVALAYSLYAGFPETAYLDGLLAAVWTLYRIATASPTTRFAFIGKVIIGTVGGLLLSAPVVLPFLEYQHLSDIGHTFAIEGLPPVSFAALLFPYIYGPVAGLNDADPSGQLGRFWGTNGGYLDVVVLFLAILGAFTGKMNRGLRIILLLWMAVILAKLTNVPFVGYLLSFVPGMEVVVANRYSETSWAMAAAILIAFALEDWRSQRAKRIGPFFIAIVSSFALALLAIYFGSGVIHALLHTSGIRHYGFWLSGSIAWSVGVIAAVTVIFFRQPGPRAAASIAGLLAINAVLLYTMPTLAGKRDVHYDFGLVHFLEQHLGRERFYTLGPFSPNYGAYFRVASINHNAIPIPRDWIRYIDSTLDPGSVFNSSLFVGSAPGPFQRREEAVRTHLNAFEQTGVKYLVVPSGSHPFVRSSVVSGAAGQGRPLLLSDRDRLSGELADPLIDGGWVRNLGVLVGVYGGGAQGNMRVEVCADTRCSYGTKSLLNAPDRQTLDIPLDTPLRVDPGEPIRYTLTYLDRTDPARRNWFVFVWLWPSTPLASWPSVVSKQQASDTPEITLTYGLIPNPPADVYKGQVGDAFEFPHPASYFETTGFPCAVAPDNRQHVHVSCPGPAVLIRREFFYPGWHAVVNGREAAITRAGSIFQSISVPGGESTISFSYRPRHIGWAYLSATVGLLCLLSGVIIIRVRPRSKMAPLSTEFAFK